VGIGQLRSPLGHPGSLHLRPDHSQRHFCGSLGITTASQETHNLGPWTQKPISQSCGATPSTSFQLVEWQLDILFQRQFWGGIHPYLWTVQSQRRSSSSAPAVHGWWQESHVTEEFSPLTPLNFSMPDSMDGEGQWVLEGPHSYFPLEKDWAKGRHPPQSSLPL
jgi:hypothetical protein